MKFQHIKSGVLALLSLFFLVAGYLVLFYTFTTLPAVEINTISSKQSTILTDRSGEFLFDFSEDEKRTFVRIDEISPHIINATIAIEDDIFFSHRGIRPESFIRAMWNNIKTVSFSQGGSTITQQVVKNTLLTNEKNVTRKIKEMLLALKLEEKLSKKEILELYLNTIPYGGVSYGIAEASSAFFGKKPSEVTISEAAYLAAVPNAPTFYSPYGSNKKSLEQRKDRILWLMLSQGRITREEYLLARQENVHFQNHDTFSIKVPHFVFFVKEMLEKEYGPSLRALGGARLETTIDLALQREVEERIRAFAPSIEEKHGASNIAAVILSAPTGEILSMIGSRDFFDRDIDGSVNITTSLRQPGSTFKPIVYAKAVEKGLRPETVVYDVQTQFNESCEKDFFESTIDGCYSPYNYTGRFSGPTALRDALAQSINVPAVKTLYLAGVSDTIDLAKKMGIASLSEDANFYGLSLALGAADITPLELAQAYAVFANEGIFVPYTWDKDPDRHDIRKRVLDATTARDITSILSDDDARSPTFGRNSPLHFRDDPVAVKTGTTNNSRDIWVVGYSPDLVVLVWAGNSDGAVLENKASGFSLAPLFRDIMHIALKKHGSAHAAFNNNDDLVRSPIDPAIVQGIIDSDDPHTILHFISPKNVTEETDDPERNAQYENWEFGLENWLEEHDISKHENARVNRSRFDIEQPKRRSRIVIDESITVVAKDLGIPETTYEFYVNNRLVGSSEQPTFSFEPSHFVRPDEQRFTIQVVARTENTAYLANRTYTIETDGRKEE